MIAKPSWTKGFVTGGTWCVDYNTTIPVWPNEESATRILSVERQGGGSGCNFAVDMRKLDPEIAVATIGLLGEDEDGAFLRDVAHSNGIDGTRFQVTQGPATHKVTAFTSVKTSRRTHLFDPGSADLLTPDHFDFTGLEGRMLHLGLPGTHAKLDMPWGEDANGWVTVLRRARAAGLSTNLEVMTVAKDELRGMVVPCLDHLDHLVVNDYEIGALTGRDTLDGSGNTIITEVEAAVRDIAARGSIKIIVAHFPQGAIAVTHDGQLARQPSVAFPSDQVVGTNGAGDAFAAGFFCAYARDQPLQDALALGHAAAAASLRAVGTTDTVMSAPDCLALAARYGWRDGLNAC